MKATDAHAAPAFRVPEIDLHSRLDAVDSLLRIVPGDEFVGSFASDRSHMVRVSAAAPSTHPSLASLSKCKSRAHKCSALYVWVSLTGTKLLLYSCAPPSTWSSALTPQFLKIGELAHLQFQLPTEAGRGTFPFRRCTRAS